MKLSVIVPAYNEQKTIGAVINKLSKIKIKDVETEIIVVDDGSTDGTGTEIQNSKFKIQNLKVFGNPKNLGKAAAVRKGLSNASGDYIIIQDADLEYDPKYIPRLLEPILRKEASVVFGTRLKRRINLKKEESRPRFVFHYFGNKMLSFMVSVLYGQNLSDITTCYKLFPKKALSQIRLREEGFSFDPEIVSKLLKKGYRIAEVPIVINPRGFEDGKKLRTVRDGILHAYTIIKYRFVD